MGFDTLPKDIKLEILRGSDGLGLGEAKSLVCKDWYNVLRSYVIHERENVFKSSYNLIDYIVAVFHHPLQKPLNFISVLDWTYIPGRAPSSLIIHRVNNQELYDLRAPELPSRQLECIGISDRAEVNRKSESDLRKYLSLLISAGFEIHIGWKKPDLIIVERLTQIAFDIKMQNEEERSEKMMIIDKYMNARSIKN
jgi:hypothetical protein